MKLTNNSNIPLALAVFFASDYYPHNLDNRTISVTSLLNSIKPIILSARVTGDRLEDLRDRINSVLGTANHDALKKAWITNYKEALSTLDYPQSIIDKFVINPEKKSDIKKDSIIVFTEYRTTKKLNEWIISGEFDICIDGKVQDMKNEKAYSHIKQTNIKKHIMQMSIYKWLNPDIITESTGILLNIVSDWNLLASKKEKNYPQNKVFGTEVILKSNKEVESWLQSKLHQLTSLWLADEKDIPICTKEDLWQDKSKFKYYKNPVDIHKQKRSSATRNSYIEVYTKFIEDGSVGKIIEVPALAKKCNFCSAFTICNQRKQLQLKGLLAVKK